MEPLISCTEDAGTARVRGELDIDAARMLLAWVGCHRPEVLDLSGVTFVDSGGLSALVRLRETTQVRLCAPSSQIIALTKIVGLDRDLFDE